MRLIPDVGATHKKKGLFPLYARIDQQMSDAVAEATRR